MKTTSLLLSLLGFILLSSCSSDDDNNPAMADKFVAAFEKSSRQIDQSNTEKQIKIVFSSKAPQDGTIKISMTTNGLVYGENKNFTTEPPTDNGLLKLPIKAGKSSVSFTYKAKNLPQSDESSVDFSIDGISISNSAIQGNTLCSVIYGNTVVPAGNFAPEVGGPNEPNQVFVDLSRQEQNSQSREKWDLGFYSGDEFRISLNGSLFMFARSTGSFSMNAVDENSVEGLKPNMNFLTQGSNEFVDDPTGAIEETAIQEISANDDENPVYLLKLGNTIGTETPETGSVAISGEPRGFKKIRVLRSNDGGYILRYADLNASDYHEINIPKTPAFHFNFFSFNTDQIVNVSPQKTNWDIKFTTFTEVLDLPEGGQSAYGFSDFVSTNVLSNVQAYQVDEAEITYEEFTSDNVNENEFLLTQRAIGANWRSVFDGLYSDRFFVLKDPDGNIFKIKFTALVNSQGERGYPQFNYNLL